METEGVQPGSAEGSGTEGTGTGGAPEGQQGTETSQQEATQAAAEVGSEAGAEKPSELAELLTELRAGREADKQVIAELRQEIGLTRQELAEFRKWAEENPVEETEPPAPTTTAIPGAGGQGATTQGTGAETQGGEQPPTGSGDAGSGSEGKPVPFWKRVW